MEGLDRLDDLPGIELAELGVGLIHNLEQGEIYLYLHQHPGRVLDDVFDALKEGNSLAAINQAMIVG